MHQVWLVHVSDLLCMKSSPPQYFVQFIEVNLIHAGIRWYVENNVPDSKVNGANMGPIWDRQDPDGSHVGPTNFAIRGITHVTKTSTLSVTEESHINSSVFSTAVRALLWFVEVGTIKFPRLNNRHRGKRMIAPVPAKHGEYG